MHVLDSEREAGNSPGNELHLHGLAGFHATNWVIAYSLICSRKLACGECTRLDCYDMIAPTGDFGMAIISLGRLYLCCLVRLLLPMPHPCNTDDVWAVEPHAPWLGHIFHLEWAQKLFGLGSYWAINVRTPTTRQAQTPGPDLPLGLHK
jgi:hypothetical protein